MMTRSVVSGQSPLVTSFAYDYDNRLVKITYPDGSVIQFGYDGLGRRVWRQDNLGTRYFFYDGDKIIAEREGNSWVFRHLLGLMPCGFVAGGQVRIYHADRLGSVRYVTDANQNILVSYVYKGFGKIIGQNGGGGGPYQFCGLWGYRNDHDAGLMHVGARYHEPETGRFVQRDPTLGIAMNPQSLHVYVYCQDDPINYVDPNGLDRIEIPAEGPVRISIPGYGKPPIFIPRPPTHEEPLILIIQPHPKFTFTVPCPDPKGPSDVGIRIGPFPLPEPLPPIFIEKPPGDRDWWIKANLIKVKISL